MVDPIATLPWLARVIYAVGGAAGLAALGWVGKQFLELFKNVKEIRSNDLTHIQEYTGKAVEIGEKQLIAQATTNGLLTAQNTLLAEILKK